MLPRLCMVLVVLAVAACARSTERSPGTDAPITANTVAVGISGFDAIVGRDVDRTRAQIGQDITRALAERLDRSDESAVFANVVLDLTAVRLTSRAAAFAFGGPSRIEGVLMVTHAETGAVLFGPEPVTGTSETMRLPGVIGVATSPSAEDDYRQTVAGFANAVWRLLNGSAGLGIDA